MKEIILVISPQKQWKLWKAVLFAVRREGEQYVVKGSVDGIDNDDELWSLWRRCGNTDLEKIYEEFGKKFRTQDKFWESAEDKVKRHVKHVVDMRMNECVRMATEKDIPIYIRHSYNDEMYVERNLVVSDMCVVPRMHFVRGENDIRYSLSLLVNGKPYNPRDLKVEVVSNTPALFAADMNGERILMQMDESFSAALLEPFTSKDEVIIPRKIENDYMHRFILKNVAKTEIEAEGFCIDELDVERKALLCMERSFDGHAVVAIRYQYGKRMYDSENKGRAEVRLEEYGDGYRFVRVSRNAEWEKWCKERLCEKMEWCENNVSAGDGIPSYKRFGRMSDAVEWLSRNFDAIHSIEGFGIRQFTSNPYYIGSYSIEERKAWQNDWLNLHISIILDDGDKVPFMYFRDAIINGEREVMLQNGKVFLLPEEWFAKYGGMLMLARCDGQRFVIHSCQLDALGCIKDEWKDDVRLTTSDSVDTNTPAGLQAVLRPYQKDGFNWLYRNFMDSTGCCLADEMGLGKTVQTIALLLKYKERCKSKSNDLRRAEKKEKKRQPVMMDMFADFFAEEDSSAEKENGIPYLTSIVICPSSLVHNWRNELLRFAPDLSVCEYMGNKLQRSKKLQHLMQWNVVITTYRTVVNDIEMLSGLKFGICVFDESQMFKNRSSQIYAAMKKMQSMHRIALSGTPMENNLNELWSLMNILNDRLLGDFRTFHSNFTAPISENLQSERTRILERTVAPYFLCRHKNKVLGDLPPRQDIMVMVDMDEEQEKIYTEELSAARNVVLSCMGTMDDMKQLGEGSNMNVLAAIGRLRQLANDPRLLSRAVTSAKTVTVLMHLEELYGTEHKVLIFSDYVSYLEIMAQEMNERGWKYDMLTGETQNREQIIRHFNEDSCTQFFLISLKAGGVGLNLTSADYVFMLTPWWNKAAEEQAVSRAYRIGQERGVFVYNFVTRNTLEEQILTLQDRKTNLVDAVLPFLK